MALPVRRVVVPVLMLLVAVTLAVRARFGLDLGDGTHAVELAMRLARGDLPFRDEMNLQVLGAWPAARTESTGMWSAMIPISPSTVLALTTVASPDQTSRSAATRDTCIVFAIGDQRPFWISAHLRSTSSRPPHMKKACSGTASYSPSVIALKACSVSASGTKEPG